jgi:hypothetical protein
MMGCIMGVTFVTDAHQHFLLNSIPSSTLYYVRGFNKDSNTSFARNEKKYQFIKNNKFRGKLYAYLPVVRFNLAK